MTATDPSPCPLCHNANHCVEVARAGGEVITRPCWCHEADFTPALLEKVPPEAKNQSCICQNCVRGLTLAHEVN